VQPGITVPGGATAVTIAADGTVSASISGQAAPQTLGQLQLASFINPAGLEPRGGNIYGETAASGTPNAGAPGSSGLGGLQQGFVEGSNVNVVEELVSMIATQRAYELNSKAIQTSDQMLQRLGQL
jgi:flagellar basal-body rod protein FlgG